MDYILLILHIWKYDSIFGYSPNHGGFKIWIVFLKNHTWNSSSSILFWHPLKRWFINMTSYCLLLQSKQQTSEQKQNLLYPYNTIDYFLFMFLSAAFCYSKTYLIRAAKMCIYCCPYPALSSFQILCYQTYLICWRLFLCPDFFLCQIQLCFYSFYSLFMFLPECGSFPLVKIHKLFHLDH